MHPADFHQSPETTFGDDIFMPKHLTPTTRAVVLALQEAGLTYRQITEKTGFSQATIARLVARAGAPAAVIGSSTDTHKRPSNILHKSCSGLVSPGLDVVDSGLFPRAG